jgi:hypothetical protein
MASQTLGLKKRLYLMGKEYFRTRLLRMGFDNPH